MNLFWMNCPWIRPTNNLSPIALGGELFERKEEQDDDIPHEVCEDRGDEILAPQSDDTPRHPTYKGDKTKKERTLSHLCESV